METNRTTRAGHGATPARLRRAASGGSATQAFRFAGEGEMALRAISPLGSVSPATMRFSLLFLSGKLVSYPFPPHEQWREQRSFSATRSENVPSLSFSLSLLQHTLARRRLLAVQGAVLVRGAGYSVVGEGAALGAASEAVSRVLQGSVIIPCNDAI